MFFIYFILLFQRFHQAGIDVLLLNLKDVFITLAKHKNPLVFTYVNTNSDLHKDYYLSYICL